MHTFEFCVKNSASFIENYYQLNLINLAEFPMSRYQIKKWFWKEVRLYRGQDLLNLDKAFSLKIAEHKQYITRKLKGLTFTPSLIGKVIFHSNGDFTINSSEHAAIKYICSESTLDKTKWQKKQLDQYAFERCVTILADGRIFTKLDLSK